MIKYISLKEFRKNPKNFSDQDKVWLCSKQKLSEKFMRDMKDYLIWNLVCTYQDLSEEFMGEMKNYVDWNMISICQELSEEFMDKYSEYLNWHEISNKQAFSEEFAWRHLDEIDVDTLMRNVFCDTFSETFYRALFHRYWNKQKGNCKFLISPSYHGPKFSKDFVREFRDMFNFEIMDFYKKKNKKEIEKLWEELKDRIGDDKTEWNFFVLNNSPSIKFLKRWREYYIPEVAIRKEKYNTRNQKIIDAIIDEFDHIMRSDF